VHEDKERTHVGSKNGVLGHSVTAVAMKDVIFWDMIPHGVIFQKTTSFKSTHYP
jgi:hypothetical protein